MAEQETGTGTPQAGPGAKLKAARERQGKSLQELSKQTRITGSRLAALEADDYDRVGTRLFIVGYIRQCAKRLGLNANELVEDFERQCPPEDSVEQEGPAESPESGSPGMKPRATSRMPLLWLVLLVVAAWVLAVYLLQPEREEETPQAEAASEPAVANPAREDTGSEAAGQDIGVPETAAVAQPAPDEAAGAARPDVADVGEPLTSSDGSRPDEAAGRAQADPLEESASAVAETATDLLAMNFSDDCWVEVRDATGNLLFAQLQQPGDNLRLTGQAPFEVLLGNARAVSLSINGHPVDIDPAPNRNTLRLTVQP